MTMMMTTSAAALSAVRFALTRLGLSEKTTTPEANPHRIYLASSVNPRLQGKPLRIVRILESGQPTSQVGRMVISGRMADVCAELDRLAEREAMNA
jgi:hypothetical protein